MSYISGFDVSETTTDQQFKLGTLAQDFNGDWYQYIQSDATGFTAGDVVIINELNVGDQATLTASAPGTGQGLPVGVPTVTFAASEYGWIKRTGTVTNLNVATSCAAHTNLNTTATAGRIDDDAGAGSEVINGITTTGAEAANAAAAILIWPYVGRTL